MKRIGISQRVVEASEYPERRDALDQRWFEFLECCGCVAFPLPNRPAMVERIIREFPFGGFVLSGGNNLVAYGGDAPERDETERRLLQHAETNRLPLLGVCRGMQMIQHHFGGRLVPVSGHVGTQHAVICNGSSTVVNSYHGLGALSAPPDFEVEALADDGVVEAMRHRSLPVAGVMWHPERCTPFRDADVERFVTMFNGASGTPNPAVQSDPRQ